MGRYSLAVSLLLVFQTPFGHGFSIAPPPQSGARTTTHLVATSTTTRANASSLTKLSMADQQQEPEAMEEQETMEQEEEQEEEEQEEEQQQEDPEVTALKEEIADLESTLKARERDLQYNQEKLELYSKAGYARRVAEMENMRRARSRMNSSSREVAVASVLQSFLPVLDEFEFLEKNFASTDFGKSFSALGGIMRGAFKELGVEEYSVKEGDVVNKQRVTVVEEEYSDEFEKDTVIRPVAVGMELQGNVMRMAECVVSLGSEADEQQDEEEEGEEEASSEEEGADEGSEETAQE